MGSRQTLGNNMNFLPFFVKKPKLNQRVDLKSIEISGAPCGENPFIQDTISMGSEIREGIMAMTRTEGKGYWPWMYITNPVTGQRFMQVPVPVDPEFQKVFKFDLEEDLGPGVAHFTTIDSYNNPRIKYTDIAWGAPATFFVHTAAGAFRSPLYVVKGKYMVLWSEVLHQSFEDLQQLMADEPYQAIGDIPDELVREIRSLAGLVDRK